MMKQRLAKDFDFHLISNFLKEKLENPEDLRNAFEEAFLKWYSENPNNSTRKIYRKSKLTLLIWLGMENNCETAEKICSIINEIKSDIKDAEKIIALMLQKLIVSHKCITADMLRNSHWSNNAYVMKCVITQKVTALDCLGDELKNDEEFMLHFVDEYATTMHQWLVYRSIGEKLKYDNQFLIKFLRKVTEKYNSKHCISRLKEDFSKILTRLYNTTLEKNTFIIKNADFWNEMGEILKEYPKLSNCTLRKYIIAHSNNESESKVEENSEHDENDITPKDIAPSFAESKETTKKQEMSIYSEGTEHYKMVEKYLSSDEKISTFCYMNHLDSDDFRRILANTCKIHSDIAERYNRKENSFQLLCSSKANEVLPKIMNDESYIYTFARENESIVKLNDLISYAEDEKQLINIVISAIISENLRMNDYIRLFSDANEYARIIRCIKDFFRYAEKLCPELEGKDQPLHIARNVIGKLAKYEEAYNYAYLLENKRGVLKENGEIEMVEMTSERINKIINYLNSKDEYICAITVDNAIMDFIRGYINID